MVADTKETTITLDDIGAQTLIAMVQAGALLENQNFQSQMVDDYRLSKGNVNALLGGMNAAIQDGDFQKAFRLYVGDASAREMQSESRSGYNLADFGVAKTVAMVGQSDRLRQLGVNENFIQALVWNDGSMNDKTMMEKTQTLNIEVAGKMRPIEFMVQDDALVAIAGHYIMRENFEVTEGQFVNGDILVRKIDNKGQLHLEFETDENYELQPIAWATC